MDTAIVVYVTAQEQPDRGEVLRKVVFPRWDARARIARSFDVLLIILEDAAPDKERTVSV